MQETGRRGAPSLFCPFATHRTVHQALLRTVHRALLRTVRRALLRTACQALLRTAWRPPAPAPPSSPHRRPHRSRVVRIIAARRPHFRPHLRPLPVTSRPHSRPRRPPCLPLPGGFSPTFRCAFRTRHATNVCTFVQHAENKYVTIKTEKRQPPDRKQVAFFWFPDRAARRFRSVICTMLFFAYIGG